MNESNELKEHRIKMIDGCLEKIKEISELYRKGYPAFTLIEYAWGHINALHHIESETNFDDETLGVGFTFTKINQL